MSNGFYDTCRGACFHPGGFELTRRAMEYCGFKEGAAVLDVGCGTGGSAEKIKEAYRLNVTMVEPSVAMSGGNSGIINADVQNLPFEEELFDGVLCECVLSLTDDISAAFRELYRVVKPFGLLIMSDVYSKGGHFSSGGPFNHFYTKDELYARLDECGFTVVLFEEHTRELVKMAASLIMQGAAYIPRTADMKNAGYLLIIAKRR